jgi:hypothetical protein
LNNSQSKNYVRQRIEWKEDREELERIIEEERNKNQVLQQQVASQRDKLKKSREDLQDNHSNYTQFINKTLQIKEREVEELKKLSKNLQNQVEISPK